MIINITQNCVQIPKIVYGWGSTPYPAYDALPDSLLGWGYDKLPTLFRLSLTHFTSSILSLEKKIFWITTVSDATRQRATATTKSDNAVVVAAYLN